MLMYKDILILGPYIHFISWFQGNYDDIMKVGEAADLVLATNPSDLIAIEMNCLKFEADMMVFESVHNENLPPKFLAKITIELHDSDALHERLDLAPKGEDFTMCIENLWQKVKKIE